MDVENKLRAFSQASTDITYRMSPDWSELRELDGRGVLVDTVQSRRDWIDLYVHPDDKASVLSTIQHAIQTATRVEFEHRVRRADGSFGWTLSRAVPILDANGAVKEWFGAASDVSRRHIAEGELSRLSAETDRQRRFYQSLISVTPDLVYAFDREYRFIFANHALLEMWGRTLENSVGKRLIEVGYEDWHAEMHEREIDQVIATKSGIRGEVGFPHASLGWRTYDYIFMPVLDENGEVEAIAGTTRDITEIKRSEEHLGLLINELNHRVKNTLTTIQSIARQTFTAQTADAAARSAFEQRLVALSNAHTVLTKTSWEGADLRDVAAMALAAFGAQSQDHRFSINGDSCELAPKVALALTMALHELASNALKYGALSTPEGRIHLTWHKDAETLRLVWEEMGGPKVTEPTSKGFGTRLLERNLARELGGSVRLAYWETGVVCQIDMPFGAGQQS